MGINFTKNAETRKKELDKLGITFTEYLDFVTAVNKERKKKGLQSVDIDDVDTVVSEYITLNERESEGYTPNLTPQELRTMQNKVNINRLNHGQEPFADDQIDEIINAFGEIMETEKRLNEMAKISRDSKTREFQAFQEQHKKEIESGYVAKQRYGDLFDSFTHGENSNKSQFGLNEHRETKRYGNLFSNVDDLAFIKKYERFETLYKMVTGKDCSDKANFDYNIARELMQEIGIPD